MGITEIASSDLPITLTRYHSFQLTKHPLHPMLFIVHPLIKSSFNQIAYFVVKGKAETIRVKDAGSWAHQSTSMFEYGGGPTVIESATPVSYTHLTLPTN